MYEIQPHKGIPTKCIEVWKNISTKPKGRLFYRHYSLIRTLCLKCLTNCPPLLINLLFKHADYTRTEYWLEGGGGNFTIR